VRPVRYAVGLPNVGDYGDPRLLVRLAVAAEEAGWDGVFVWDHVLYHDQGWPLADPTVTVSAIAQATSRVRLGVLMTALPRRRVAKVARETATLDVLSGGRLVFGAGLGSSPVEYTAFGEDGDLRARAARLDESLDALAALWTGREVTRDGGHVTLRGVTMRPTPVQRPRIPVWCAGRWPARTPFRRAAWWDGVMPTHADFGRGGTMPPEELARVVAHVARCRREAGRSGGADLTGYDVALEGATEPSPAGRARVQRYAEVGLTWWVEALGWWRGTPAQMHTRVRQGPPTR
jgi:alkanesulfonate monooxygenase SsuD/methylene tetrahydromethanopterin reductase-like flavin-dependent oxidoreductase (luciferase family)